MNIINITNTLNGVGGVVFCVLAIFFFLREVKKLSVKQIIINLFLTAISLIAIGIMGHFMLASLNYHLVKKIITGLVAIGAVSGASLMIVGGNILWRIQK